MNKILKILCGVACAFVFCFLAIGYAAVQDELLINGSVSVETVEQAYAVYSADDNSLEFFYGRVPGVGGTSPTTKTVTAVYTGIENQGYSCGWSNYASNIKTVRFIGGIEEDSTPRKIQPKTMSSWFNEFKTVNLFDFSELDTSNVTSMYQTFRYCEKLETLDLTSFNTSNVESMQGMFQACKKVKVFDVSNFDTSKVTTMQHMFSVCYAVETLDLSSFKTNAVTNMSAMFSADEGKSILKNINLNNFDTSNVTDMTNMFYYCEQLTSLDLRSFDTSNVTNMEQMFMGCKELITIYVDADGWSTAKVKTAPRMFEHSEKIIGGGGTTYDSTKIDKTYARIDNPPGSPGYFTGEIVQEDDSDKNYFAVYGQVYDNTGAPLGNALYFYNRTLPQKTETSIALSDGSVLTIDHIYDDLLAAPWSGEAANVKAVNIVDEIEPTSTAYWFRGFSSCESFKGLEKLKTTKATHMTNMFKDCKLLKDSDLSAFIINTASAKSLNGMFYNCISLTNSGGNTFNFTNSAVIADANAEIKLTDLRNLFIGCKNLKQINLTQLFTAKDNVYFAYMFYYCENITTITFSDREILTFAPVSASGSKTQSGTAYMFANCFKLTEIDISFIKCKTTSAIEMFSNCKEITTIIADTKFEYDGSVSNAISMFAHCDKLVGGNGTNVADTEKIERETYLNSIHARIDGHNGYGGYLTGKHEQVTHASVTVTIADGAGIKWNGVVAEDGSITGGFVSEKQHAFFANGVTSRVNELKLSAVNEGAELPAAVTVTIDGEDKTSAEGVSYDSTTGVLTIPGKLLQFSGSVITIDVE